MKTPAKRSVKTVTTRPYDSANYLTDDASIVAYIEEVIESGDPTLVSHALGVVARAKGMAQIAREAGVSREHLYRALSSEGNPEFGTVFRVIGALGLRLSVEPKGDLASA
jgi:probable addiction module antidote protein